MTKYFIDADNNYIGAFDGPDPVAMAPLGAIEINDPPPDGRMKRQGKNWVDTPESIEAKRPPLDLQTLFEALKTKGVLSNSDVGR